MRKGKKIYIHIISLSFKYLYMPWIAYKQTSAQREYVKNVSVFVRGMC